MALMQVVLGPDRQTYEAVNKIIDFEHNRPVGYRIHAAGELPNGRMRVVAVWESQQDIDNFYADRLVPAFKELGFDDITDVVPETTELVDLF